MLQTMLSTLVEPIVVDPWYAAAAKQVWDIVWPAFVSVLTAAVSIIGPWILWKLKTRFDVKAQNEAAPSVQRSIDAGVAQLVSHKVAVLGEPVPHALEPEEVSRVVETVKRDNPIGVSAGHETDVSLRKKVEAAAPTIIAKRAEDLERIRAVGR